VILAQHHEQDMFKMGGLKNKLPAVFWTFLIGSASLSALPLVTAGFYSKDLILWKAWSAGSGGIALWAAGLFGAFITSIYTFRMVFLTFFGGSKTPVSHKPGAKMLAPLIILAVLSIIGGFVEQPETLGNLPLFSNFLRTVFSVKAVEPGVGEEMLQIIASIVSLAGVFVAYLFFVRVPQYADRIARIRMFESIRIFWLAGWDFDAMYDHLLIRPFMWLTRTSRHDFIDSFYSIITALNRMLSTMLSKTQTGNIRWYAMGMVVGAVVFLGIVMFLQ
jgi:NADH-quinone oxidoreductase subunit L